MTRYFDAGFNMVDHADTDERAQELARWENEITKEEADALDAAYFYDSLSPEDQAIYNTL